MKVAAGAAGLLGAATGALLLFAPRRVLESGPVRLLLEADVGKLLNYRYSVERRLYRQHRITGAIVLAGAAASLVILVVLATGPRSIALRLALGPLGFSAALGVAGAVGLLLLLVGFCLVVRPSALKSIEAAANRWYEPRASSRHIAFSRAILRAPRLYGALLLLGGLFCIWPF